MLLCMLFDDLSGVDPVDTPDTGMVIKQVPPSVVSASTNISRNKLSKDMANRDGLIVLILDADAIEVEITDRRRGIIVLVSACTKDWTAMLSAELFFAVRCEDIRVFFEYHVSVEYCFIDHWVKNEGVHIDDIVLVFDVLGAEQLVIESGMVGDGSQCGAGL